MSLLLGWYDWNDNCQSHVWPQFCPGSMFVSQNCKIQSSETGPRLLLKRLVGSLLGTRKTLDNNDLNQVVASSGFSENKGLTGVLSLRAHKTWCRSFLFKDFPGDTSVSYYRPFFPLVPRNNPRRLCQFPLCVWRMGWSYNSKFFKKIVNKSQWNLNATHKVSGNQIKFSLHRLLSNWLQGNGFSFFLASSFDRNAPRTNTVFCSIVIQIFSLGHLWSDAEKMADLGRARK